MYSRNKIKYKNNYFLKFICPSILLLYATLNQFLDVINNECQTKANTAL